MRTDANDFHAFRVVKSWGAYPWLILAFVTLTVGAAGAFWSWQASPDPSITTYEVYREILVTNRDNAPLYSSFPKYPKTADVKTWSGDGVPLITITITDTDLPKARADMDRVTQEMMDKVRELRGMEIQLKADALGAIRERMGPEAAAVAPELLTPTEFGNAVVWRNEEKTVPDTTRSPWIEGLIWGAIGLIVTCGGIFVVSQWQGEFRDK